MELGGGGQQPKEEAKLAFSDTFLGAEGDEKLELLDFFWKKLGSVTHFWRRRRRYYEKFRYLSFSFKFVQ